MKTRKMLLLFFGVKGMILLAPLSFFVVHYMITSPAQQGGSGVDAFSNGFTKLMYAAQRNDVSAVQQAINAGADLDLQSTNIASNRNPDGSYRVDGSTALHMACTGLDSPVAEKIIALLINAGANPRIKTRANGDTPLHSAAYSLSVYDTRLMSVTEMLVKNGADINARNDDGNTLMYYAVDKTRADWIEAFLSGRFGALFDRSLKNNKGETSEEATRNSHRELLDYYKKPAPTYKLDQYDPNGLTGLMIAVIRGDMATLQKVPVDSSALSMTTIEQGPDKYGYTALDLALLHQRSDIVPLLMERGANPNVKDARGNATLHLIYKLGAPDDRMTVIKALVPPMSLAASSTISTSAMASSSMASSAATTAAVSTPKSSTQKEVSVKNPADLNIQDARGNTLLHLAVMRNDQSMIKFLLDTYRSKLNLSVKNSNTDTPAQLARKLGYIALQDMLNVR